MKYFQEFLLVNKILLIKLNHNFFQTKWEMISVPLKSDKFSHFLNNLIIDGIQWNVILAFDILYSHQNGIQIINIWRCNSVWNFNEGGIFWCEFCDWIQHHWCSSTDSCLSFCSSSAGFNWPWRCSRSMRPVMSQRIQLYGWGCYLPIK